MIDSIKVHVGRHKVAYSFGTGAAIAGITCIIMRGRTIGVAFSIPNGSETITNRPLNFLFFSKQTQKIVNVIEREGRGHPGYITECVETGERWVTQSIAAKDVGTIPIYMSKHVRGLIPDIYGKHYRRIPA